MTTPTTITCTARDLMRMPEANAYGWFCRRAGGNTVFLLPDGETTATVIGWADHAWRAPYMNGQIELFVNLHGPAAALDNRQLLELTAACWLQRSCLEAPPWCRGLGYWKGSLAFTGEHELTLMQAMPHDCGAEPGTPCNRFPYLSVCTPTRKPVVFQPFTDPGHRA